MHPAIAKERGKFEQYLCKAGLRFSPGRRSVFDLVMRTHEHFTAEGMAKTAGRAKPPVSRATVYRTIHELVEAGIARETAFGDKHRHYEHLYDERRHHHAICVRCHNHIEFPDMEEEVRYHPVLEKKGFKILGHEMHFYGVCRVCQEGV